MSLVSSGSVMPKPPISVVDEPRPVPNSNRPFETWSIIATRSATRAGWFTGGVTLMIPRPDVDLFGAGEHPRHEHLVRGDVRVLLEEVVLGEPGVLPVVLVADLAQRDLAHEAVVLGVRVRRPQVLVDEAALEQTEFHGSTPTINASGK